MLGSLGRELVAKSAEIGHEDTCLLLHTDHYGRGVGGNPRKKKRLVSCKKNPFQAHFCEKHLCSDTTEQSERLKLMLFVAVKQVMHIHVYTQINHIN